MDKAYTPEVHDQKWQKFWEEKQIANPDVSHAAHADPKSERFVIMMPPPNVTGVLHQGHALMLTLEDTLIRWERMRGKKTLYLPGTDHASIAVQMQVVKHLAAQKINYRDLGREGFLKEAWKWIETYRPRIYGQIRALGVSCDWSRVKFTMDQDLNVAVNRAFVQLYEKGLIYRAQRLVNWCPKSLTVLSDLEVIFEEREGKLWHIRYPLKDDPSQGIIVATTRPETMLGDTAVAVHPDDERYRALIGKKLVLPFTEREIPIVADAFVDRSFGSGAVKITPAHDFADFEVGERHGLPLINIFTPAAKIVANLPGTAAQFAGLDRFDARKEIVERLAAMNLLVREEVHRNRVGMSERGNVPVEPYLSKQWFCKMDTMAAAVVADLSREEFRFLPHEFHNQFMRWMENIRDWCISRQLWWGHSIPAYYCEKCENIDVSETPVAVCSKCGGPAVADPDVLDTWFSSALWPFSTLGWPAATADLAEFYPTQVLETGFDILFFWVARMLLMGKEFTGVVPFKNVYMHPLVRDEHGQKMSKSKGNVTDPLDIVHTVGADSLRMTFNALCVQGRDLRLSLERIEGYRNFINKIWNATKFVMMEPTNTPFDRGLAGRDLASEWILGRLDDCAYNMNRCWEDFRMQEAAEQLYHFFWNDFCDWFLEISKTNRELYQPLLVYVLNESLKLLHPICPHVSEELWHELDAGRAGSSLALQKYPEGRAQTESAEFAFFKEWIVAIRVLRNESKVPLSKVIPVIAELAPDEAQLLAANLNWVEALSKTKISVGRPSAAPHSVITLTALAKGRTLSLSIPVSELVNSEEEIVRVKKELGNLSQYINGLRSKLGNEAFVARAPQAVVDIEKTKLQEAEEKIKKLGENLKQLESL